MTDSRICERNSTPVLHTEDGDVTLPHVWEVCPICNGEGKHVNPSIDAGGLTASDFENDPDFKRDYFAGVYDINCNCCGGLRVVKVIDYCSCCREHARAYRSQEEERYEDERLRAAERAMGA